ncbi:MAG: hypothetical protein KJ964_06015 [Verrucomicrobia bacterium]|nr:hypothetical protein [Verrucomicrobiota bacterium]MBU1736340.1 hypothetical protein [Verrucomicrobiota bacterium]MBU1857357.1 hypothetical protein [Verrucomicrobiota bacterium]
MIPNDPLYKSQWHLNVLKMEGVPSGDPDWPWSQSDDEQNEHSFNPWPGITRGSFQ